MTIFVIQHSIPPKLSGALQHYTAKISNGVYATMANSSIVSYLQELLLKNKVTFSIVKDSKHGIIPEIAVF
jgi:hypothetical protein